MGSGKGQKGRRRALQQGRRAEPLASPCSTTHSQRALMGSSCTQAQSFWAFILARVRGSMLPGTAHRDNAGGGAGAGLSKAGRHRHGAVSLIFPQTN